MNHATGDVTAHLNGVLERLNGGTRLHLGIDRVPVDPARESVFDCAVVELAFTRFMFRDVDSFALVAANTCRVRPCSSTTAQWSSWTGGPGLLPPLPRFFPKTDHQPLRDVMRPAVRSAIASPASRASSSETSGYIIFPSGSPATGMRPPAATPRLLVREAESICALPAARLSPFGTDRTCCPRRYRSARRIRFVSVIR